MQRWHGGECGCAQQPDENDGQHPAVQRESHQAKHDRERNQASQHGGQQTTVCQPAAEQVAGDQARTEDQQDRRHGGFIEADDLRQQRGDISEYGEHAGIAQYGSEHPQQHQTVRHGGQIGTPVASFRSGLVPWHEKADHGQCDNADAGHRPEGGAPVEGLAQPGAERHAQDVGDRQACEHESDGGRALVRRHQVGGHHGTDAEEGAVGERGQHPSGHQEAIAWGECTGGVAQGKYHHQAQQHPLARPVVGHGGEQRCSDDDAQRVARDQPAGCLDGDTQIGTDVEQQAHDDEFGHANAKGTGG